MSDPSKTLIPSKELLQALPDGQEWMLPCVDHVGGVVWLTRADVESWDAGGTPLVCNTSNHQVQDAVLVTVCEREGLDWRDGFTFRVVAADRPPAPTKVWWLTCVAAPVDPYSFSSHLSDYAEAIAALFQHTVIKEST